MENVEFIDLSQEMREDARGFSFFPLVGRATDPAGLPGAFHLVSIAPGQARGNHLHPGRREWLYPFHGTGFFMWEPRPGDLRERLVSGHRLIIRIPPGVPHALRNPGPEPIYILAWREGEADAPDDTLPHPLG
jgi:oxalate decarboxylase/phosphoglucose isomerase-like protein (cupin superfamily)